MFFSSKICKCLKLTKLDSSRALFSVPHMLLATLFIKFISWCLVLSSILFQFQVNLYIQKELDLIRSITHRDMFNDDSQLISILYSYLLSNLLEIVICGGAWCHKWKDSKMGQLFGSGN